MADYTERQRQDFGARLRTARAHSPMTRQKIAVQVGLGENSGAQINQWEDATIRPPSPPVVFSLERILDLEPGTLSHLLGYLPIGVELPDCDIETALATDPALNDQGRDVVLATYRALVSRQAP